MADKYIRHLKADAGPKLEEGKRQQRAILPVEYVCLSSELGPLRPRHSHSWAMSILLARMFNAKRPLRHIQSSRLCVSEQIPRCCGCRIRRLTNGIKRRMGRMLFDKICTRHEPSKGSDGRDSERVKGNG
ncbi:predicted protein [Histoplasma capsulatum H143]|uniref:Uncharacterized protein n=1 Tax=Ajellomyces capsulatus (strain H143) TaxID=544712 RepID=C6HC31_AJECH|nr:predicted protein [Histoplasma capsulatum H143]